ncbi:OmpA family protein [Chryseobacterium arachidis]|uniref:OmpA family protein n=1 Tax=Chryseobacterium arachidis TaxID=1416778 RepID=A0A1M4UI25_9FLAO|nr:OmpA family protein [Chryseobacterium arachidis]SHE56315.1 OmpA family protein [Chryseobacterium arachidis]
MKTFLVFLLFFFFVKFDAQMLTSVYFEYDSYKLNKVSQKKLDSLAQLKSNLKFRIFGNCDISGSSEYNKKLSENRAHTVNNYLQKKIGNNIKLESVVGLGKEKQINDNSSEELRGKNRRVDIFIDHILDSGEIKSGKSFASFFSMKVSEMKVGDVFSLPDVNFVGGRHVWLPKGDKMLIHLANILKDNPNVVVELQGHICCDYDNFDGEDLDLKTFNLSFTRANAIKEFLIKQGIDSKRIEATGQGHLNPVVYPERKEEDFIKNRRVEIVLLKK